MFTKKIDLIIINIYNSYINNKMAEQLDFSSLNLPIPEIVYKYSKEKQQEIFNYLQQLDEHDRNGYLIAKNHLGTSFNICKSNGYKEWQNKNK
jgi:hypothetical protein